MSQDTSAIFVQPRRPSILIGELRIFEPRNGQVLISVESGPYAGEAASMKAIELQALIENFYKQNF